MITKSQKAKFVPRMAYAGLLLFVLTGCTARQYPPSDQITVSGIVTARGNEPFSELLLETDHRLYYVLDVKQDSGIRIETPGSYTITGRLYKGDWNGRPFARIRVEKAQAVRS